MKIAFLVTHFPRLSETFVLNQITGLIDRGNDVDIFARERSDDPKVHEDVVRYGLQKRTYYFGSSLPDMPDGKAARFLKALCFLATHLNSNPRAILNALNVPKFGREAASLRILYEIMPFVGHGDYDVIHCHFGPNGRLAVRLKDLGLFSGKVVTVFHGYDITRYVQQHGAIVYGELFRRGDLFLPISERWKELLVSLGCSEGKIIVHRMGVDLRRYARAPRRRQDGGGTRIVTIARFVEKKGLRYGIEAVGRIAKEHPGVDYRIIGDGALRRDLEERIAALELGANVKLLGWRSQEEILEQLREADILLVPSVTGEDGDQEGIPVVLMEAMALGVAVVSTYHSGIPELVEDGVSGFLATERNVEALAGKLRECLEDRARLQGIVGEARRAVERLHNVDRLNDRLVAIYRQLREPAAAGVPGRAQ